MSFQIDELIKEFAEKIRTIPTEEYAAYREFIIQKLVSMGDSIVDPLMSTFQAGMTTYWVGTKEVGQFSSYAHLAFDVLVRMREPRMLEILIQLIKNPAFANDRFIIGEALIQFTDHRIVDVLIDVLHNSYCDKTPVPANMSEEESVFRIISELLIRIGDPRGIQAIWEQQVHNANSYGVPFLYFREDPHYHLYLLNTLQSKNSQLRAGAARILGQLQIYPAVPMLIQQLKGDPDEAARAGAASALIYLKAVQAIVYLMVEGVNNPYPKAWMSLSYLLKQIEKQDPLGHEIEQALKAGIDAMGEQKLSQIFIEALQRDWTHRDYPSSSAFFAYTNKVKKPALCELCLSYCMPLMSQELKQNYLYPALQRLSLHPDPKIAQIAQRLLH